MTARLLTRAKKSIYQYLWLSFTSSAAKIDECPVSTAFSTDLSTQFGRRLIPSIIDERAEELPESCVYSIPLSAHLEDGFKDITWLQLANAINYVAWWIEDNFGRSGNFETIAYFGPTDIGYAIIAVAAHKTGHKVFFSSLWNDLKTHLRLLELSNCRLFITSINFAELVDSIMTWRSMKHLNMPEMSDILGESPVRVYPYMRDFQKAQMEPFAVFHTSGSTGFPKLITITHGTMAACDAYQSAQLFGYARTQVELYKGKRIFAGIPSYHAAGMFYLLAMPAFYGSISVVGPCIAPTAALASKILEHGNVNILILRPDILGGLADEPGWLERLENLDYVMNAACDLPKRIGDKLATKTSVTTYMGATETMLIPLKLMDRQDWDYITPSEIMGAEFRLHHGDLYELFIVRDPRLKAYQSVFYTFPHLQEYSMNDLYSRHPTEPHSWRYRGRVDGRSYIAYTVLSAATPNHSISSTA